MHPCPCVDEIVRLVAYVLVASKGKASAAALARCCKTLQEPVLDALWEHQEGLTPLLESLPGDVWNTEAYDSFGRLPTTLEWARFRIYARRIRTLKEHNTLPLEVYSALQFRPFSEPLLPSLKSLELRGIDEYFISFIPLFLSPRITSILLGFEFIPGSEVPKVVVASMITSLPTSCPNLRRITFEFTPRDPMITAAVSELLLTINRNTLQRFHVDSPLTEEATEVICKISNLRCLRVVIGRPGPLPALVLPNLTAIDVEYDDNRSWLQGFRGATLGKLSSITFRSKSSSVGDFFETFGSVALSTSIPATLSKLKFRTSHPWRPNYRLLLPFTKLKRLDIGFSCGHDCLSTLDDDVISDLARAMPNLETLRLGAAPCHIPASVTFTGLSALAYHCLCLSRLCIHFRLVGFDPPEISQSTSTIPRANCALTDLQVGCITVPGESTSMVAVALHRIFPRLETISRGNIWWEKDSGWEKVAREINCRVIYRKLW